MRRLGIIGGVSWHSSAAYYAGLNAGVEKATRGKDSASLVLSSMNLGDILRLQKNESSNAVIDLFLHEGRRLKASGCDAFLIASHTFSIFGSEVERELNFEHLSLFSSVEMHLAQLKVQKMGLIGSLHTMRDDAYVHGYEHAGLSVVRPQEPHLSQVAKVVFRELVRGVFRPESRGVVRSCLAHLAAREADAIVLGCTELGLLIPEREWTVSSEGVERKIPLIDLIDVHVEHAVRWLLVGKK